MLLSGNQNKVDDDLELLVESNPTEYHLPMEQHRTQVKDDSNNVGLQWKNISVSVRPTEICFTGKAKLPSKEIISNVSGTALPGTLLAILGSSGSGKTTLLNALTLRCQKHLVVDGMVLVNGQRATPRTMDGVSAYIQQDDLFFGKMTVKEQLNFYALLSMDNTNTKIERRKRVETVMQELGLDKCQDTMIGIPGRIQGISGGEKRRLSIASQILSDPALLFCDEPTSGLDASSAQSVIVLLRNLAAKGKTILCTIHQPSSGQYVLFHRIMLMAHGKLAFIGTSDDALAFFNRIQYPCPDNSSPADHFIHVLSSRGERNASMKICEAFASLQKDMAVTEDQIAKPSKFADEGHRTHISKVAHGLTLYCYGQVLPIAVDRLLNNKDQLRLSRYKTSFMQQFQSVLWRSWLGVTRDTLVIFVKIVANIFMAIIVGYVYWNQKKDQLGVNNINVFVILFTILLMIQCIFSSVHVFSEERPLFQREKMNRLYSTRVYVLTKSIVDLPEFILFPFFQTVVVFSMIGMADNWQQLLLSCFVVVLAANSFVSYGYVISSINSTLAGAIGLVPFMIVPLMAVGTSFMNLSDNLQQCRKMLTSAIWMYRQMNIPKSIPWYFRWLQHISMFKYTAEALIINQWKDVTHIECNLDVSTCARNGSEVLQFLDYDQDNIPKDIFGLVVLTVAFRILAIVLLSIKARRRQ